MRHLTLKFWIKNVGTLCQVWVGKQCAITRHQQSRRLASEFQVINLVGKRKIYQSTAVKNTFSEILPGKPLSWNQF